MPGSISIYKLKGQVTFSVFPASPALFSTSCSTRIGAFHPVLIAFSPIVVKVRHP